MGVLSGNIIVLFGGKKYVTTRARFSALIAKAVKKALPEGYVLSSIQASTTTESQYVSIVCNERFYALRISSHVRINNKYTGEEILTNDCADFSELILAIQNLLVKSHRYLRLNMKHYLVLYAIQNLSHEQVVLFDREANPQTFQLIDAGRDFELSNTKFSQLTKAMINYSLVTMTEDKEVIATHAGNQLIMRGNTYFPSNHIEALQALKSECSTVLIQYINDLNVDEIAKKITKHK